MDFRQSWQGAGITLAKTLELAGHVPVLPRPRVDREKLVQDDPAAESKGPLPRLPFSDEEVNQILSKAKDDKELAFFLVLRHTGLRIGDATLLRVHQVSDSRIHLYTTKAGTPVSVVIPPSLSSLLKALPQKGGHFFLRGESTHVHSASDAWRKRFKLICKELKISPDHPHRMRHTLAADLLTRGISVENVAAILGNTPAIVQRHYAQWIKTRQDALDAALEATWQPQLRRVK